MLEIAREERGSEFAIPRWTFHDCRRTAVSGMARLGIALPVIEKVVNHSSGSFAGIVGVYQRHSFADEKRMALQAWANFVLLTVEQRPANVVSIKAAR
jgi:integrase